MNDPEQALAYARADFEEPHNQLVELFRNKFPQEEVDGYVLDLGCGTKVCTIGIGADYAS